MSSIEKEMVLYNTPYFEELISEFYRIIIFKRHLYKSIKNHDEFLKNLTIEEKKILTELNLKETSLLKEIVNLKNIPELNISF